MKDQPHESGSSSRDGTYTYIYIFIFLSLQLAISSVEPTGTGTHGRFCNGCAIMLSHVSCIQYNIRTFTRTTNALWSLVGSWFLAFTSWSLCFSYFAAPISPDGNFFATFALTYRHIDIYNFALAFIVGLAPMTSKLDAMFSARLGAVAIGGVVAPIKT